MSQLHISVYMEPGSLSATEIQELVWKAIEDAPAEVGAACLEMTIRDVKTGTILVVKE